jgi:hypothetical protein
MSQVAIGAIPTKHLGLKVAVKARPCTVPQSSSLNDFRITLQQWRNAQI